MSREPAISVVMSVYNEPEKWLHESIRSILNQTFSDFEFIIINDNPGRTKNREWLEAYKKSDNRIVLLENVENLGLPKSLNIGLQVARGKYIARMDADDISHPLRFEKQYRLMEERQQVIVCGTRARLLGVSDSTTDSWIFENETDIKARMLMGSCFHHPSVMIRRSVLEKFGIRYDEEYRQAQDYRLWEVLADYGEFYNLQERLLDYRISRRQMSSHAGKAQWRFARMIRKRLVEKWLLKNNICLPLPEVMDVAQVKVFRHALLVESGMTLSDSACNNFIRALYLSASRGRLSIFLYALRKGDLRFFARKDIFRFLRYALHLRHCSPFSAVD